MGVSMTFTSTKLQKDTRRLLEELLAEDWSEEAEEDRDMDAPEWDLLKESRIGLLSSPLWKAVNGEEAERRFLVEDTVASDSLQTNKKSSNIG